MFNFIQPFQRVMLTYSTNSTIVLFCRSTLNTTFIPGTQTIIIGMELKIIDDSKTMVKKASQEVKYITLFRLNIFYYLLIKIKKIKILSCKIQCLIFENNQSIFSTSNECSFGSLQILHKSSFSLSTKRTLVNSSIRNKKSEQFLQFSQLPEQFHIFQSKTPNSRRTSLLLQR